MLPHSAEGFHQGGKGVVTSQSYHIDPSLAAAVNSAALQPQQVHTTSIAIIIFADAVVIVLQK